jgi:PPK2 family polyphosphate:nucleotide phosphotransferase
MISAETIELFRVKPNTKVHLKDFDPDWEELPELETIGKGKPKERARTLLESCIEQLSECQEALWADDRYAVLMILQAMDAAGKDGTIKHVMSGLNPQGCQVFSFKRPSDEELDHDFLWRCAKCLPERGRIGIFNRSYYEEVLVVKVHPEFLERQKLPPGSRGESFWKDRYEDINNFERHLVRNGTAIVKFFLHVSKDEQKQRLLERLEDPQKHWKFSLGDLPERALWREYMQAFEDALSATSTPWAPWYVIPANHKWVARPLVAGILAETMRSLDLRCPELTDEDRRSLEEAKRKLEAE